MPGVTQRITYGAPGGGPGVDTLRLINVLDYGAVGAGLAEETTALQSALDAAEAVGDCVVWLPMGTYLVNSIFLSGTNIWLCGPGVLKLKEGSTGQAALRLYSATSCGVRGVTVDGSREFDHAGLAAGIQIDSNSSGNFLVDTFVRNTKFRQEGPEDGEGYMIAGRQNILVSIRGFNCGYAAVSIIGDDNQVFHPHLWSQGLTDAGIDHGVRAFMNKGNRNKLFGGVIDQSAVTFDSSVRGHTCYQSDPLPDDADELLIDGTTFIGGGDAIETNVVKIARCGHAILQNIKVIASAHWWSVRFAEACRRITMKNCQLDTSVYKENNLDDSLADFIHMDNVVTGLSATHRFAWGFEKMRAKRMLFERCQSTGTGFCRMEIDDDELEECVFDGNWFYGTADAPASNAFARVTDVDTMMLASGKYIYLPNNRYEAIGSGAFSKGPTAAKNALLSTIDRTGRNFELSAAPTDSAVSWRLRDRVYSTATPAAGSPDYWVCKVAGAGGTSGQWQAHNL